MKITKEDIEKTANLAKIKLDEEEKHTLIKDFESILSYMDKLDEFDIDVYLINDFVYSEGTLLRDDDEVAKSYDRDKILDNAPSHEDGYFKVPKTF